MAVAPDSKDWTWVLDRRCPECGFDSTAISGRDVARLIRRVAQRWQAVLTGPSIGVRPVPEQWSPLEYGCHIRDVLRICDARLQLMLIQTNPAFPNWDQDQTALDADYGGQDPAAVATGIGCSATRFAADLESLGPREWERTGRRSDGAHFTVETFARYVAHDPIHHLSDVGVRLT